MTGEDLKVSLQVVDVIIDTQLSWFKHSSMPKSAHLDSVYAKLSRFRADVVDDDLMLKYT